MSNQNQPISQDRYDGRAEIFKVMEVYLNNGGTITIDQLKNEQDHWLSNPIQQKTQTEIEKSDLASRTAQARELKKQLKETDDTVIQLLANVDKLPGALTKLAQSLSPLSAQ